MALEAFTNEKQASVCPYEEPMGHCLLFAMKNCKSITKGGHVFLMTYPDLKLPKHPDDSRQAHYNGRHTANAYALHHQKQKGATPAQPAGIAPKIYHIMRIRIITP